MSGEGDRCEFREWLVCILELLSWTPERQLDHVNGQQIGADEIALQFDDAFHAALGKVHDGLLSHEVLRLLVPIDVQLKRMTEGGKDVWTEAALSVSREWQELRAIAGRSKMQIERLEMNGGCARCDAFGVVGEWAGLMCFTWGETVEGAYR